MLEFLSILLPLLAVLGFIKLSAWVFGLIARVTIDRIAFPPSGREQMLNKEAQP